MLKILVISQYFPPDITAAAFRVGELVRYLARTGDFDVQVLTTYPHKLQIGDITAKSDKDTGYVDRIKIKSKRQILQYAEFIYKAKNIIRHSKGHFDWILLSSPPMFLYELMKPFYGKSRIFLDIRDLWPDTAVAAGKLRNKALYRFFKSYERKMYQKADRISVVSRPMQEYLRGMGIDTPVTIAYNGIPQADLATMSDLQMFAPTSIANDKKTFDIFYAGNLGLLQGLEIIPEAIKQLSRIDNLVFHFIGSGVRGQYLREKLAQSGNVEIVFHDPMEREDLLPFLKEHADAMFINLKKHWILEKTIPSKVFDYLLIGKPVICGIKGEGKRIFWKTGGAVFFEQDSAASLASAIEETIRHYPTLQTEASRNMPDEVKHYIREDQFSKIAEVMSGADR